MQVRSHPPRSDRTSPAFFRIWPIACPSFERRPYREALVGLALGKPLRVVIGSPYACAWRRCHGR